jgi:hypothetical protein
VDDAVVGVALRLPGRDRQARRNDREPRDTSENGRKAREEMRQTNSP